MLQEQQFQSRAVLNQWKHISSKNKGLACCQTNAAQLNLQLLFNLIPSPFSLPYYTQLHWKWTCENYKEKYKKHLCHGASLSPLLPCLIWTQNYTLIFCCSRRAMQSPQDTMVYSFYSVVVNKVVHVCAPLSVQQKIQWEEYILSMVEACKSAIRLN